MAVFKNLHDYFAELSTESMSAYNERIGGYHSILADIQNEDAESALEKIASEEKRIGRYGLSTRYGTLLKALGSEIEEQGIANVKAQLAKQIAVQVTQLDELLEKTITALIRFSFEEEEKKTSKQFGLFSKKVDPEFINKQKIFAQELHGKLIEIKLALLKGRPLDELVRSIAFLLAQAEIEKANLAAEHKGSIDSHLNNCMRTLSEFMHAHYPAEMQLRKLSGYTNFL